MAPVPASMLLLPATVRLPDCVIAPSWLLAPRSPLMLPLVFLLLDYVTNLRLLLLWGVGPPPHVKLWPSYALLGLLCVPHVLVGAVVHFRLLAIACLPPALKVAAVSEDQLLSEDILPPGAGVVVHVYSWLFGAPAWLAYPLILLLLGPGVLLLTLLCWVAWTGAGVVGATMGVALPAEWHLDFVIPLIFMVMLVTSLRNGAAWVAAVTAGTVAVVAQGLPFNSGLIVGTLAGIVAGSLAGRAFGEAKE